jgi:hypothetical protein
VRVRVLSLPAAARPRVVAWALACIGAALGCAAGCGVPSHPPALAEDDGGAATDDDAGASLISPGPPPEPTCTLGPEGGVCACVDQTLLTNAPNLYFVLDRSGSMNDNNKWTTIQGVLKDLVTRVGPRARFGAAVFPGALGTDACAAGVPIFPPSSVAAVRPGDATGATALAFLTALGPIGAAGGTPTAATLRALAPELAMLPGQTYVILATDGGPNCNGAAACSVDQCQPNIEGAPGCPAGGPTNCCNDPQYGGALSCLDAQPTLQAVQALAGVGIPVYVVGVPGSQPYAQLLDQLAVAGGTARVGTPQYYAVDTAAQSAFQGALSKVVAKITATCTLKLDAVPANASLVNVFFDGQVVPQLGPDGWTLSGATVTLQGASCQRVLSGDVIDVRIVAGCPTVLR